MKPRSCLIAAAPALLPATAWAHGDHEGAHGLVHVLSSPAHLGILLLAGLGAVLLGRRLMPMLRRIWARLWNDGA